MKKLLLPFDGSSQSQRAVDYVLHDGLPGHPEIHLLNVQPPIHAIELWHFLETDRIQEGRQAAGEAVLRPARDALAAGGVAHVASVSIGRPADAILRYAREQHCDGIVMATRRKHPARKLLGSVSLEIAGRAGIPLTLVGDSGTGTSHAAGSAAGS